MNFHKTRHLFPDKNSISTVQLNKLRRFEYEHLGPGTYASGIEKIVPPVKKTHGNSILSSFGTNTDRNLDHRPKMFVENPGPGTYSEARRSIGSEKKMPLSCLKSVTARGPNLSADPSFPGPSQYSLQDHDSISKPMLQGCLLYTSPSPRDATLSRMPSSA